MKKFFTLALMAAVAICADAQTDSLSMEKKTHELQEVVVKSDVARTSAEKSVFLPTRKQRNAAVDATALLQHMMIPQLSVDPISQTVKTITNEEVSIFIDYMPATKDDLTGMNTQDVKRVEIYDFPKDIRFQNKPHVLNFVMQRYELGGYTKLSSTEMIMADFTAKNSVYSKFAYRKWTLDANLSHSFFGQSHIGNESVETFNLPAQTVKRTELSENGRQDKGIMSSSLRATYSTEKIRLANRLELLDNNTMKQNIFGNLTYQPDIFNAIGSASHLTAHETTPTYTGDWYFELPKQWALSVSPQFQYTRNRKSRRYSEGENMQIENDITENATTFNWTLNLGKTFAGNHSLSLTNYGMDYCSDLDYKGSTVSTNDLEIFAFGQGAEYALNTEKLNLTAELVFACLRNNVNGETEEVCYPIASIEGRYSPNKHNSVNLFFNYNSDGADGSERNPSVMQENELMFYCGNPALKNYQKLNAWLQYSWMPSNLFTASAYAQHYIYRNYYTNIYELYNDGAALIRRIENVGDAHKTNIGINLTLRLLDSNLQLGAYPDITFYRYSGQNELNGNVFQMDLRANYYVGQFYFTAGYKNPKRIHNRETSAWQLNRSNYYLIAGWGNAHWKARLELVNPFRTDWRATKKTIVTPLYSRTSTALNNNSRQHLTFTLTYIFNYGKKVKQGNELGTASGGQSSIL